MNSTVMFQSGIQPELPSWMPVCLYFSLSPCVVKHVLTDHSQTKYGQYVLIFLNYFASYILYTVFNSAIVFNSDVARWDTSSVTTMELLFSGALVFNSDVSKWDISRVIVMTSGKNLPLIPMSFCNVRVSKKV